MGYVWQRWLADDFRAAGLRVVEIDGWKNRGRPASVGSFDPNGAHTKHHTGTTTGPGPRNAPTLRTCIEGRPDLPGPLCQWLTGYDGTVYVIAAGRANHAGPIGKSGVPGMPRGGDGNRHALGDEVDTDGTQELPLAQRTALAVTAAVVARRYARDEQWTHRHADISASGKWDIGQLSTPQLRALVRDAIDNQEDGMAQEDVDELKRRVRELEETVEEVGEGVAQTLKELRAFRRGKAQHDPKVRQSLREILDEIQAESDAEGVRP